MMFLNAPETWCQHDKPYDSCRHCELEAAVEELVTAVEGLAHDERCPDVCDEPLHWVVCPHDTSDDTATITDAADNLKERLGE